MPEACAISEQLRVRVKGGDELYNQSKNIQNNPNRSWQKKVDLASIANYALKAFPSPPSSK